MNRIPLEKAAIISSQDEIAASKDYSDADCRTVVTMLDRIGDKWVILIVGVLMDGPVRFNAILRSIDGLSHRMLTYTLRALECDGLVNRIAYPTIPPRVEYELTDMGRSLIVPLATLTGWVRQHHPAIERARQSFEMKRNADRQYT